MPANSNISEIVGQPQAMNVWQWMLRQGDTTMPASESGSGTPPVVNAGGDPTVTLPTNSVTLTGTAQAGATATISSGSWTQVSGPNTATIGSIVNSLVSTVTGLFSTVTGATDTVTTTVSGLVAGTYVFELTANENNGLSSSSTVAVVVNPAVEMAPTVSAGKGQAISLPTSSTTLTGTATGNNGATISTVLWRQDLGPATATIADSTSLSTSVTGLTTEGAYVFTLYAIDDDGKTANGSMTVTVNTASAPPTVSAGKGQVVTLPASSTTLTGTATGNDGATISTVNWRQDSGPATVTIADPSNLVTAVTGMTSAGSYIFTLYATDNNGRTANGSMTVTVYAAGTTAVTGTAISGQAMLMTDSTLSADSAAAGPQLYPNPVQDLLNIRLNDGVAGKVVVSVFTSTGSCVRRLELEEDPWGVEASIDVSGLPKGVYFVQVFSWSGTRRAGKFIKL
jgi:Secretion system C-terminal sorting domain